MKSETIGKLAEALSKAQSEIRDAAKDKNNPFFKSSYADLSSVWEACRDPLSRNGLSVAQPLSIDQTGKILLTTLLMHSSGEWMDSILPIEPVKKDPQGIGSAITYMRRFALSALVGVAASEKPTEDDIDDDDDANAASGRPKPIGRVFPEQPAPEDGFPDHSYRIPGGKYIKRKIEEINPRDLAHYIESIEKLLVEKPDKKSFWWDDFVERAEAYLGHLENSEIESAS